MQAPLETASQEPGQESGQVQEGERKRFVRGKSIESSISVIVFIVLLAAFGIWLKDRFLSIDPRLLDVHQNVPILILGLAVLVTLLAGLFDLSVSGVATLSCFLTIGLTVREGWPFWIVLLVALMLGVVTGLINGVLVEKLHVNTFIATLGTGGMLVGLSAVYSGGTLISPLPTGPQVPAWFASFGAFADKVPAWIIGIGVVLATATVFLALARYQPVRFSRERWMIGRVVIVSAGLLVVIFVFRLPAWVSGVSWTIFILLLAASTMLILIAFTTFGRELQAIGSNRTAARLAGVKVERQVIKSFVVGGVLASGSGVILAASQGSAAPDIAGSFLLPAFAAAFVSTVIFSNGRFTVPGTVIGGILVVWTGQALVIGGLPPTWINVVDGFVLIGAVALSTAMRSRR